MQPKPAPPPFLSPATAGLLGQPRAGRGGHPGRRPFRRTASSDCSKSSAENWRSSTSHATFTASDLSLKWRQRITLTMRLTSGKPRASFPLRKRISRCRRNQDMVSRFGGLPVHQLPDKAAWPAQCSHEAASGREHPDGPGSAGGCVRWERPCRGQGRGDRLGAMAENGAAAHQGVPLSANDHACRVRARTP